MVGIFPIFIWPQTWILRKCLKCSENWPEQFRLIRSRQLLLQLWLRVFALEIISQGFFEFLSWNSSIEESINLALLVKTEHSFDIKISSTRLALSIRAQSSGVWLFISRLWFVEPALVNGYPTQRVTFPSQLILYVT